MEVVTVKGQIDEPKGFSIMKIHGPTDFLGRNIYRILTIEASDDADLILAVCSRIRGRYFANDPLDGVYYKQRFLGD